MTDARTIGTIRGDTERARKLAMLCTAAASAAGTAAAEYPNYVKLCMLSGTEPAPPRNLRAAARFMSALGMQLAFGCSLTVTAPERAEIFRLLSEAGVAVLPDDSPDAGEI